MADKFWFIIVDLGPLLLGAVIAYSILKKRRLTSSEKMEQKEAVEQLYDKPEGGRDPTFHRR
jgi:hypothetical protein